MTGVVIGHAMEIMAGERHRFSVCPHDTAKTAFGWVYLNAYLQNRLKVRIGFEPMTDVVEEREAVLRERRAIVYANPTNAARYADELGHRPLARPVGRFDEALLVAGPSWRPEQLGGPVRVASATDQLAVHSLGIGLLAEQGIQLGDVEFVFTGHHLKAAQAAASGQADLAFVFNETWAGTTEYLRGQLTVLAETADREAFHCFLAGGALLDRADDIRELLVGLADDPKADHILEELGQPAGFEAVSEAEFRTLCDSVRQS